jgi:hypothetical protein
MERTTESTEALRLKCTLLEIRIESLTHELKEAREGLVAQGQAHDHFKNWIGNIHNYKKWVTGLTTKSEE